MRIINEEIVRESKDLKFRKKIEEIISLIEKFYF